MLMNICYNALSFFYAEAERVMVFYGSMYIIALQDMGVEHNNNAG